MLPILQPLPGAGIPDFLTIGHVTRDILPTGGFSLGGTVTFAALTASSLGLATAIVTCADAQLASELPASLPGIGLAVRPSLQTTTFTNLYHDGLRTQYLRALAEPPQFQDVPAVWRDAPVILLGPLAQEISDDFVTRFPRRPGKLLAATPQGWLRRWDIDGLVRATPWAAAEKTLPLLDALILSHDDLLPLTKGNRTEADAILARWSLLLPLLVATDGRHGATLFQHGLAERFTAYPTTEIDPTGAGDVFAAAFLYYLSQHKDPRSAVQFANCAASFSVEEVGVGGIPTLEMVRRRMK